MDRKRERECFGRDGDCVGDLDHFLRRHRQRLDELIEERQVGHPEMTQEKKRRLPRDIGRRTFPVLAALDKQCVARVRRIVEERIVAQPAPGRMTAIDDDVRGRAERLRKLDTLALPAGHRERRARVGHRMQVEQIVDGVVERPQLTRAVELDARARALEHLRRPQPVEVLVDTARRKRLRRIERPVRGDVGEADRQRPAQRTHSSLQQPVECDRAADLVAMRQRLHQHVGTRAPARERPYIRNVRIAGGPAPEVRKRDLDRGRAGESAGRVRLASVHRHGGVMRCKHGPRAGA